MLATSSLSACRITSSYVRHLTNFKHPSSWVKPRIPTGYQWSVEKDNQPLPLAKEIINEQKILTMLEKTKEAAKDVNRIREIMAAARDRACLKPVDQTKNRDPSKLFTSSSCATTERGAPCCNGGDNEINHEFVQGLTLEETATLLNCDSNNEQLMTELYSTALYIKQRIYGNRIVLFAPLYLSNYCVNTCTYCAFRGPNGHIERALLTQEDLKNEVIALQKQGHRRLLLLTGEHPKYPFDKFLDAVKTVASVTTPPYGSIRRINVEIPPLSITDFKRLKDTGVVGTYTLFQETYHEPSYQRFHPGGFKSDYQHRLQTMHRAQLAGVDDVGIGALFGLYDYKFEVMGLLSHAQHLDQHFNAGPHTISIPRMQPAANAPDAMRIPSPVNDADFKKLVAIIRCAVPYTGMILSTRESKEMRHTLLQMGVSQLSAGSKTDIGAYVRGDAEAELKLAEKAKAKAQGKEAAGQFELADHRSLDEVVYDLMKDGFVPSWCTACYRLGRTGEKFMNIAKKGDIHNYCHPNALLTLNEYVQDYASPKTRELARQIMKNEAQSIESEDRKKLLDKKMKRIEKEGQRDLYF